MGMGRDANRRTWETVWLLWAWSTKIEHWVLRGCFVSAEEAETWRQHWDAIGRCKVTSERVQSPAQCESYSGTGGKRC